MYTKSERPIFLLNGPMDSWWLDGSHLSILSSLKTYEWPGILCQWFQGTPLADHELMAYILPESKWNAVSVACSLPCQKQIIAQGQSCLFIFNRKKTLWYSNSLVGLCFQLLNLVKKETWAFSQTPAVHSSPSIAVRNATSSTRLPRRTANCTGRSFLSAITHCNSSQVWFSN